LLRSPAIRGLTDSLTDSSPTEWRTILARPRRARLLAGEDPHNPGQLDTHPLVREYFGEQPRSQQTDAWKECNRRLFDYYQTLAAQLPNSFREMEPLSQQSSAAAMPAARCVSRGHGCRRGRNRGFRIARWTSFILEMRIGLAPGRLRTVYIVEVYPTWPPKADEDLYVAIP
jgi:hypothetical protein